MSERTEERAMLKAWEEMESDRHRDAAVAIHVMGGKGPVFTVYKWADRKKREWPMLSVGGEPDGSWKRAGGWWRDYSSLVNEAGEKLDTAYTRFPRFSTDPAADYSVLEKVRSEWGKQRWNRFQCKLYDIQTARRQLESSYGYRWVELGYYAPGDWSRAAYETVRQEAGE